jgi:enoyl-CoA hydratase/carnithine racemase
VSATDVSASSNGRGSDAWAGSWTHFSVDRRSPGYCRVTFEHPPMNTVTATTVAELSELIGLIEEDDDLNVVVFESADAEFHLADRSLTAEWVDALVRLSRAPVVSIAWIRGHVGDAGAEFVSACDLRAGSRDEVEAIASRLA